jgi:hypothetical protein
VRQNLGGFKVIAGAVVGAIIGWIIWSLGNRGHFEPSNFWVWDRKMGPVKGIAVVIVCAAIGTAAGAMMS